MDVAGEREVQTFLQYPLSLHHLLNLPLSHPPRPAFANKVSAAAALAAPSKPSLHIERIGEGIEPRLADLNNTEGETTRADELVQPTGNHDHHPSYSMSRDSGARGPSALGHDDAATLLQSRVRGYSVRRHFGGTNNVTKERGGSSGGAIDGAAKVEKRNVGDNETDGAALEGENTIMDGRGECPVLELEVSEQAGA